MGGGWGGGGGGLIDGWYIIIIIVQYVTCGWVQDFYTIYKPEGLGLYRVMSTVRALLSAWWSLFEVIQQFLVAMLEQPWVFIPVVHYMWYGIQTADWRNRIVTSIVHPNMGVQNNCLVQLSPDFLPFLGRRVWYVRPLTKWSGLQIDCRVVMSTHTHTHTHQSWFVPCQYPMSQMALLCWHWLILSIQVK